MLVQDQIVEITWNSFTKKYYESKGYKYTKIGDKLKVKIEDLPKQSHMKIKVICDYCGKEYEKKYDDYYKQCHDGDCCNDCKNIKARKIIDEKYTKEDLTNFTKEGIKKNHGVEFGIHVPGAKEKIQQTNLKRYGANWGLATKEIQEKVKETCLQKYGEEYIGKVDAIIQKRLETLSKNGRVLTSKQQIDLYDLLLEIDPNCVLNKQVWRYFLDCAIEIDGIKIDVEYDGNFWHEKRKEKDEERDKYIISRNYKVLRIIGTNKIPPKEKIIKLIDELVSTDKQIIKFDMTK